MHDENAVDSLGIWHRDEVSRLRQLGRDSLIYGLGGVFAKGIGFFLLPIYTRIFPPAEFGTIEMLTVITAFLSSVMGMGMDSAQSMYFFKEKQHGPVAQARMVSAILQWRMIWGSSMVVLATILSPFINAHFFAGKLGWEYFVVAFSGALAMQVMGQSIEVLRLLYRPWPYVIIMLTQGACAALAILCLVLLFDQGIYGYFLGATTAALLTAFIGWWMVRRYIDFSSLHCQWWPTLLRFGAPLLLSDFAFYVMSTTDRWFIQRYHGDEALGIYAVGAKLAMLMAMAIETFRKAWWPIAMDAMHSQDGPDTFRLIARLFVGVGAAAVIALTFVSPWLVGFFASSNYFEAWPLVGILAWQSVFYGFYLVASAGIWKAEKTYLSAYLMLGGACLNLVLNYALVPTYGAVGAAIATVTAYFVWVMAAMVLSESLWRIGFPMKLMASQLGLAMATGYWLIVVQRDQPSFFGLSLSICVCCFLLGTALDRATRAKVSGRLARLFLLSK